MKALIQRLKRTPRQSWLSIQEQSGLEPNGRRNEFMLSLDVADEENWRLECDEHRVRFTIV